MAFKPLNYALYRAAKTRGQAAQPCVHMLASTYDGPASLYRQVETKCDLCGQQHHFTLERTYVINTPGEYRRFILYCESQNIERLEPRSEA
jgi:hypothetical protein